MTKLPHHTRPLKPRADFPLFPHASGVWAKKVRGKLHYFGPWSDPKAALDRWLKVKDALLAGRQPDVESISLRELVNQFLAAKKLLVVSGELTQRSWNDYDRICKQLLQLLGKEISVENLRPNDFGKVRSKWATTNGPVGLGNNIKQARAIFNFAFKNDFIDQPVKYGDQFNKPSRSVIRKQKTVKLFSAAEVAAIVKLANPTMKAMIYLGINCGLGNADCAALEAKHIDDTWLNYPRGKTGIDRRCPLWPETIKAIQTVGLPFRTKYGKLWGPDDGTTGSPISQEMRKLLNEIGVKRKGVSFYTLRRTFQTEGQKIDREATRYIMGHAERADDMSAVYNQERPSDDRLKAVTAGVRKWLNRTARQSEASGGVAA